MVPRILIVGAGATGAVCADKLRQTLLSKIELVVWEKSKGTGGRMSTSRSDNNDNCLVDLGAQYVTATPAFAEKHAGYYSEFITSKLLQPLTGVIDGLNVDSYEPGTKHYVASQGISSLVKHFIKQSEAIVHFNQHLAKVETVNVSLKSSAEVKLAVSIAEEEQVGTQQWQGKPFDAIILTMPVPQVMQIQGAVQDYLANSPDVRNRLEAARYSTRYALGLFFSSDAIIDVPWVGKYVTGDPCIRWLAIDNRKRGIMESNNIGPSMVVHTNVPFAIKYLETDKDRVQAIIMEHLRSLVPNLPQPVSIKCQRWRYSQVSIPVEGAPGCVFLTRLPSCAILATGDAFTNSNLDGCISAAEATCDQLLAYLKETGQL